MRMTAQERHDLLKDKLHKNLTPRTFYYKVNQSGQSFRFWRCECECGNFVDRYEYTILRGLTESCGCLHPRNLKGKETTRYKGCEDLNGQYISILKGKAKERDINWSEEITPEYLWNLFILQDKKCKLTKLHLNFESDRDKKKGKDQSASLDRIDSLKGYEIGNLQWIHKDVNKMKNNLSQERFIELCRLISQESQSQKSHAPPHETVVV